MNTQLAYPASKFRPRKSFSRCVFLISATLVSTLCQAQNYWPTYNTYVNHQVANVAYPAVAVPHYIPPIPTASNAAGLLWAGHDVYQARRTAQVAFGAMRSAYTYPVAAYAGYQTYNHIQDARRNSSGYVAQYGHQLNQPIPQPYFNSNWYPMR